MSTHDLDIDTTLGNTLHGVLARFAGRSVDDALVAEMAEVLNEELASVLDGRRIQLLRDDSGIRVDVLPPTTEESALEAESTSLALVGYAAVAAALAA